MLCFFYDRVKEIVLGKILDANILEYKLERDNGTYVYDGKAQKNGYEYEFEINASTGAIIDWKEEVIEVDE